MATPSPQARQKKETILAKESEYNSIATALLEPFDDSEISTREGAGGKSFSYVDPARYRYRLLQVFKNGFTFGIVHGSVVIGKTGVYAEYRFTGEDPETLIRYDITVPAFEAFSETKEGKVFGLDQMMNKLTSAGLKNAARELGLGLHLYDKAARSTTSNKARTQHAASSDEDDEDSDDEGSDWDGTAKVSFGQKWKGTPYKDVDADWIDWAATKDKPDQGAVKEQKRRKAGAASAGSKAASKQSKAKPADDEDDDIPF